ncbi:MAG: 50S ribosomal protein L4, partial [Candidatus Riflebacteria bacterium RBG_13_59_9]
VTEIPEVTVDKVNFGNIAQAYRRQRIHAHPRTAKTKNRAEVWMSSAKWFRQKGTGRARQGPRSTPHLRGGGVVFGPIPGRRTMRLNKKVRRNALLSALRYHLENESVKVLQGDEFEGFVKTRDAYSALLSSGFSGRGIVVVPREAPVKRALRNIAGIITLTPDRLNVGDLVDAHFLIITEKALAEVRLHLAGSASPGEHELSSVVEPGDVEADAEATEVTAVAEGGGDDER